MEKRKKGILIWMLTWASLLLAVLYSPFGSPELYSSKNYFDDNQGVSFKNGEIANAPIVKNKARGGSNGLSVPDYSVNTSNSHPYAISNSGQNINNDIGSVSSLAANNSSNGSTPGAGLGDANFSSSKSGKNTSSDGNSQNNGFASSSSDFSLLADNNMLRQGAGTVNPLTDTTDPGGDPFGDPIPISDGWGFLLLLSAVYIVIKRFFLPKV